MPDVIETRLLDAAPGATTKASSGEVVFPISIASGYPVERWYGKEVLDMKGARLDRLNDGANVLFNHNPDVILGTHVQGTAAVGADGVLRANVRLSPATQAGRDAIGLYEGGHLTKVSTGYSIKKVVERVKKPGRTIERQIDGAVFERTVRAMAAESRQDIAAFRRFIDEIAGPFDRAVDDECTYDITDWEPYESSMVSTPADPTVGAHRSSDIELRVMAEEVSTAAAAASAAASTARAADIQSATTVVTTHREPKMAEGNAAAGANADDKRTAQELEQARINAIKTYAKGAQCDERITDHWIRTGVPLEKVADDILKIVEERSKNTTHSAAYLGLEEKDVKKWSLFRAISAIESGDWTKAGLELSCSRAVQEKSQRTPGGKSVFVPMDVLRSSQKTRDRRDLSVGTASAGGYLVDTENQGFIELLRNASVVFNMGARRLQGLQGNVTIPKQTAASTAYWLASETSTVTESTPTFGQLALSPKTCGAYNEISRQLLLQSSPDAEQLVMGDLAQVVGLGVDEAALNGSGSGGQPTGLIGTSGIGSVTGTSIAYAGIVEFQTDVATANALTPAASPGYVTTPTVAGLLKGRVKFTSTASPMWEGRLERGMVDGYAAMSSNQMPAGDMLFGDWGQMIIGEWGILEIAVNPQANFQAAIIGVRALYTVDVGIRIPAAFSLATSVT